MYRKMFYSKTNSFSKELNPAMNEIVDQVDSGASLTKRQKGKAKEKQVIDGVESDVGAGVDVLRSGCLESARNGAHNESRAS